MTTTMRATITITITMTTTAATATQTANVQRQRKLKRHWSVEKPWLGNRFSGFALSPLFRLYLLLLPLSLFVWIFLDFLCISFYAFLPRFQQVLSAALCWRQQSTAAAAAAVVVILFLSPFLLLLLLLHLLLLLLLLLRRNIGGKNKDDNEQRSPTTNRLQLPANVAKNAASSAAACAVYADCGGVGGNCKVDGGSSIQWMLGHGTILF